MIHKVGIVMVSYNAAHAVRATLASLRVAHNETPCELVLVDNASREDERACIRAALDRHVAEDDLPWRYIQQDKNLGFSGGNNVGIREFLADPTITHFCLLNSDVIVPNGWVDRLVETELDIVSPVTNKAASEQCVPIDYSLTLEQSLDEAREAIPEKAFATVDQFAARWHEAWQGNVVDSDATFFCVLLTRRAIEDIGLLDETFFPGGYEDDDYCARARQIGIPVHLARNVFMHHWGSASFGELAHEYFSENARRNLDYLEKKHDFEWRIRPEKPFVSFAQDMAFAATGEHREAQAPFRSLYSKQLSKLLTHYRREFKNLRRATEEYRDSMPDELVRVLQAAPDEVDLDRRWRTLVAETEPNRGSATNGEGLAKRFDDFAEDVHKMVSSSIAANEFLQARDPEAAAGSAAAPRPWWRRAYSLVRHGVPFVLRFRGIVFLGGYPYGAREKDGYFQRIRAIDALFQDRWRIYFDQQPLPGQTQWHDMPAPRTLVLRQVDGRLRQWLVRAIIWLLVLRCRVVYFHSVLRMQDMGFWRLTKIPFIKRVLDVHGVVPEEFRMHNDFYSAVLFERHERLALKRPRHAIVVTEAMQRYFGQKYQDRVTDSILVLPIFPGVECWKEPKPYVDEKPIVVYAGGLHKWQQVPLMIDAIVRTSEICHHRFYCPEPEVVVEMLPEELLIDGRVLVESKTHEDLLECYRDCHYGFLLRQDSVVNHVACPTKVVEYLAMGIVPIVDSEEVGDFVGLGMQFVRLVDFVAGTLPDARARELMAQANFEVYGRLRAQREAGVAGLRQLLGRGLTPGSFRSRVLWRAGKMLPRDTVRGRIVRGSWHMLRPPQDPDVSPTQISPTLPEPDIQPCDVLVQVGNFLAGGLENAVLDLNLALQAAGHTVGLLVLGEAGAGVARAREQGVHVCTADFSETSYRRWLTKAAPKLVMSHYSVDGAQICGELDVPLVQVIHNIYLWLDTAQLEAHRASAENTTRFVAASGFAKDFSVRRLGVPAENCTVIPYGIEVRRFQDVDVAGERARLRERLGIPATDFVFLNVAAFNHQKNHLSLLKSFRSCLSDCPDARLVVIGPVYEQEIFNDCRKYVERHSMGERVIFAGSVSDAHRYYAMADAYVHSAFFEGGPLTVLEALISNLPVVTVATGLAVHLEGLRGVHVVPAHFDVAEYYDHITDMKSSPETERLMAEAMQQVYRNRQRPDLPPAVIESFDRDRAYQTYVDLVANLIGTNSTAEDFEARSWARRLPNVVRQSSETSNLTKPTGS